PYCDFASEATAREQVPHAGYADAVLRELEARAPSVEGRPLTSVVFGGGTPSLGDPRELARVLAALRGVLEPEPSLEVTVECNPTSLDRARAAALREAGVDRLSIGVQSLDDGRLGSLGRLHDASLALRALADALAEVPRVSADLMFGMPGQSADDLERELERVLETGVRHVSAYALTIEPGTQFGALARKGKLLIATDDAYAECFARAEEVFARAGLDHYEVSNYARPGEEARHNLHYWRGGDYLALGAGAVGCVDGRRWRNEPRPERYLKAPGLEVEEERLGPDERVREALMLGLRTREGLDVAALEARAGRPLARGRERALERAIARGDLVLEDGRAFVPRGRWLRLDGIVADLF
ncbi:MAG: radical SAM family heme chaperone HemW, partial [Sandaracinaceae bacterium]|nr:radical SAM family heme chaperone HemW [Sandaracinaceae bacterium]